jgi:hypothetical protein
MFDDDAVGVALRDAHPPVDPDSVWPDVLRRIRRGRTMRRGTASLLAIALVVSVVALVTQRGDNASQTITTANDASPTVAAAGPAVTQATPPPLQGEGDLAVASSQSDVVVWWGNNQGRPDTASYSVASGTWQTIASPSGLRPRLAPAVVTVGSDLFVWGGRELTGPTEIAGGAYYTASDRSWRVIPDAPIGGRNGDAAAIVWTGTKILVWGGRLDDARGAAYTPDTNTWSEISPSPLAARRRAAFAWTGQELIVWGGESFDPTSSTTTLRSDGAAYNPATNRWRMLPPTDFQGRIVTAVWTGTDFVMAGGTSYIGAVPLEHATLAAYNPVRNDWRQLPSGPSQGGNGNVVLGQKIYSAPGKGLISEYDLATEHHRRVSTDDGPDYVDGTVLAAGDAIAIVGLADRFRNPHPELWLISPG